MPKYFGTDGIRAVAGQFPLTQDFVTKLGYCALKEIQKNPAAAGRRPFVIIAEDSRESGPALASYLTAGILAAGFEVKHLGIAPTPAVSYLVKKHNAICGIVISASHNPAEFNGIKFFSSLGNKLGEELETDIETAVENLKEVPGLKPPTAPAKDNTLIKDYIDFLESSVPQGVNIKGLKVVLDCANGAASEIAPRVFNDLGMQPIVIFNNPDGCNINKDCGALHTQAMQERVVKEHAYMGFSFDGDADRLIASDNEGGQLDGDNIITAAALYLKEKGLLKNNKVVLTVMANLGLINYLKDKGIEPLLTAVGDKYVFEALEKEELSLGGETSGHIIFRDISAAGDGILCALQLLSLIRQGGQEPSALKKLWKRYPLKLIPVKVSKKIPLDTIPGFLDYVKQLEAGMGGKGRIFVRYSGTEPLLRILVEGEDEEQVKTLAQKTADCFLESIR